MVSNKQAQGSASELILKLANVIESLISQTGPNEDSNVTAADVEKLQHIAANQQQVWDDSELSPYLHEDLKITMAQLEQITDAQAKYQLADQTSYYVQSFSAAMNDPDIFLMLCGGIQATGELALWKDMALAMISADESDEGFDEEEGYSEERAASVQPVTLEMVNEWADKHQVAIDVSLMSNEYMDPHDLDTSLVHALRETGYSTFGEQGSPPEEYMPFIIRGYLGQVDDAKVDLISITSDDDWNSARAEIVCNQKRYAFDIEDINQSDWVPEDLARKMKEFSLEHLNKALYTLFGEDPFLVLYLDRVAVEELDTIRQQLG